MRKVGLLTDEAIPELPALAPEDPPVEVEITKMTMAQLKEFATLNGIALGNAKTKADILDAIEAAANDNPPTDE